MMASSSILAASAASVTTKSPPVSSQRHSVHSNLSFEHSLKSNLGVSASSSVSQGSYQHHSVIVKAQMNEVSVDGSSNAAAASANKPNVPKLEENNVESANPSVSAASVSDSTLTDFMAEVASLVRLVDSRDIMELQLKRNDCELIIRKKEALPQPPSPAPVVMMQPSPAQSLVPSPLPPAPAAAPAPAPPTSAAPVPALPPPAAKSSRSSHPPVKCPMAGTFYHSPGPGEPPFVKVGDKVKKGQVLCIIEAMKLMNEIEADQSGTIVEVLVDDGKSVSVDTPLFVIEP